MPKQTKQTELAEKKWYVVDATDKILGRMASQVAAILRGKTNPAFVPHQDKGDYVIVINAEKIKVTGRKAEQLVYYRHSGYPGGLKKRTYKEIMEKDPAKILLHAIKGMIPHNKLGSQIGKKLFVYAGPKHKHEAQKPVEIKI
jgi:large subunit ribosomal protein L13